MLHQADCGVIRSNSFFFGVIWMNKAPPQLKDSTIIEEAMIACCRAKSWIFICSSPEHETNRCAVLWIISILLQGKGSQVHSDLPGYDLKLWDDLKDKLLGYYPTKHEEKVYQIKDLDVLSELIVGLSIVWILINTAKSFRLFPCHWRQRIVLLKLRGTITSFVASSLRPSGSMLEMGLSTKVLDRFDHTHHGACCCHH